jgi:hypothetical protein
MVRRTVRLAVILALCAAALALAGGIALNNLGAGVAVAVGLLLGSANGLLVRRSVSVGAAFAALSLGRLLLLSLLALAASLLLGIREGWMVIGGIALAQLLLVTAALKEVLAA